MPTTPYAELHCHTSFSFHDGASAPDDLVDRALDLGLSALAVTDHGGLYGAVRFVAAAREAGLHPVVGVELELVDALAPDPDQAVIPGRRPARARRGALAGNATPVRFGEPPAGSPAVAERAERAVEGLPARPRPERSRLPGRRETVKEDLRGIGDRQRGPHLVLLARSGPGYRSLCRLLSHANLAGTKRVPRVSAALLAQHTEGLVALSGCRESEIARRLRVGDRAGAMVVAGRLAELYGRGDGVIASGFFLELSHHLLPDDDWLVAQTAELAQALGLPVVVTNDVHYARPEDRELHDVLTAIAHGRSLETLADLRRPDGESYLKSAAELAALPPGEPAFAAAHPVVARAWAEGIATAGELAATCAVDLGFEQVRFPGFPVPAGETPFSYLVELSQAGARKRYHPLTPPVVRQLAHELDVIERTGLAEFFLICWDLMQFAKRERIPAQGRGSAAGSIIAYVLGISRVEPIRHNLLFERFINEGRTTYPDVDIDFSSERREEVIQYVYRKYGPEHTGMVCNLVTYRARSAVREVGSALGFPRPLVDRVAKALETYDSVMVRRDLEADGGFGDFFRHPGEEAPEARAAALAGRRGLVDPMGQLDHGGGKAAAPGRGRWPGSRTAVATTTGIVASRPAGPTKLAAADISGQTSTRGRLSEEWLGSPPATDGSEVESVPSRALAGMEAGMPAGAQRPDGAAGTPKRHPMGIWLGSEAAGLDSEGPGPSRSGMWEESPQSPPSIRPGRSGDDEGGPGDTPASVAWLRAGRGIGYGAAPRIIGSAQGTVDGRVIDPDTGALAVPGEPHSSVARVEATPRPQASRPQARGSTVGMSDWERWLELCARIDGFPRHLSIHSGGMLVTAAPLIDIAPLERATMPGRVVVQFDKRDVETLKLIKLDLLGLGMLAAIDETVQLIESDCGTCLDLDRLPEEIPEVFRMLQAADTVGVFQVESRAQMQTLPKSRPATLDDLVVEVAIIRPGPIQGNAVHPYLRRRQGLEPVTYLHPSLEPVLRDSLGVILYQEQVMRIAIEVAGFSPAASDGFRRAMGTWRSNREMEKLHRQFVDGALRQPGMTDEMAEELFRQVAAFASFGFAKSHAAAFARTAYESSFLKLFYPAQFLVGLINAQPMGFYPVEVLVNDARRHGVAVLPIDINASAWRTTTDWAGRPGWTMAGAAGDDGSHDGDPGEPIPDGSGIEARPRPVRSEACVVPAAGPRDRWAAEGAMGWGVRLGLHLVKGIGEEHRARLDVELARGPYRSLAEVVDRTGLREEVIERLIRAGALDSLGRPRRELLWQLREVAGAERGRVGGRQLSRVGAGRRSTAGGRSASLHLPPTQAPLLPEISETERIGDAYAVVGLDARRQVVGLFRAALDRLGAVTNAALTGRAPGPIRIGGLVVTRQHPMTARGTVFLALEDETGMVNVTLWPDTWARLRGVVRRHALLLVDGDLQLDGQVVNVIGRQVRPLTDATATVGGPEAPTGVRQQGYAGMRRLG